MTTKLFSLHATTMECAEERPLGKLGIILLLLPCAQWNFVAGSSQDVYLMANVENV